LSHTLTVSGADVMHRPVVTHPNSIWCRCYAPSCCHTP